ncbi:MAG: DUF2723 domain-containing protein [Cyclobacteriaceae bacterium]
MKNYKLINNIGGWAVFLISATVYILTMEPVASFWDCGEFIAASYKLQVPHPPGAPLFLLIGRIFSLFATPGTEEVGYWVNMVSALSSAFTILFLFWTITLLAKKILSLSKTDVPTLTQGILVIGAGLVGSLAYTFSDSFWFSAGEAEVYAMSSFFTAFVFWAVLKWDEAIGNEEATADRWVILIAYMIGLSIGVHLLNLVAIPALGMIYYFRKYEKHTWTGGIIAFVASVVIVQAIQTAIIPGLPSMAWKFELLFVNIMGLPFNSGVIFFVLLFIGAIIYGIIYSIKKSKYNLNLGLLSLVFILIGYASYAIIVIRANYHPPLNENNPDDMVKTISYLKREQYGERPLFYGPQYTARISDQKDGAPLYKKGKDGYVIYDHKTVNKYASKDKVFIPRMHSKQGHHTSWYNNYLKKNNKRWKEGKTPTSGDNISYMFSRQLGFLFFRYFKWNFIGREGDIQDSGTLSPLDNKVLPQGLSSMARNQLFALPLILGLIGLFFQFSKHEKSGIVMVVLFIMTGAAITFFLNNPPIEPRERDYTYVGCFYAFAIWIGLGVIGLYEFVFSRFLKGSTGAALATVIALGVPVLMAAVEWDDHDRSKRYHSVDSAKNLLNSCAKNAIIFTGGDNDTFPLWYVQEVEGFRTDVRVCNLSLLNTDWYIDQMKEQAYESAPLPITIDREQYVQGTNDVVYYMNRRGGDQPMKLETYLSLLKKESKRIRQPLQDQSRFKKFINTFPSKVLVLNVDSSAVLESGLVLPKYNKNISSTLQWNVGKTMLEKKDLIMLDMVANINKEGWKRPIYFSTTLGPSNYLGLKDHMVLEGLAFRFLPVKHGQKQGIVNTAVMYDNMMTDKFSFRGLDREGVFYDENYKRFSLNARSQYYRLATALFQEGQKEKAIEVIDKCFELMPDNSIPYDIYSAQFIPLLYQMGEKERASELVSIMGERSKEALAFINKYPKGEYGDERGINCNVLQTIIYAAGNSGEADKVKEYQSILAGSGCYRK